MKLPKITLVVDTSTLINSLDLVKQLEKFCENYDTELLIPQEVIQELDRLKDKNKLADLGALARSAINWYNNYLVNHDFREFQAVRGQKLNEKFNMDASGDEAILDCALYNYRNTNRMTIMLSDDTNLLARSLIEGIETVDGKSVSSAEQVYSALSKHSENLMEFEESPVQMTSNEPISEDMDVDMEDTNVADLKPPPPILTGNLEERIISNLCNLVYWHLTGLETEKPTDKKSLYKVVYRFKSELSRTVKKDVLNSYILYAPRTTVDREYIKAHIDLLKALCYGDSRYYEVIKQN